MAKADAALRDGPAAPLGVQPDGQLPLPWLADGLAAARQLAGAHALLIHGPAGAGHFDMAVLLAQTLLCESVPAGTAAARACGRCASCHLVATRAHPDLRLVLPAALRVQRGWTDEDDYIAPKGEAKPSRELRIDQVRAAIDWAQQTSGRGRAKVLLLHPADALNLSAANALLKTLEEPPGQMRVLLTSADPEHLLPTVRSRCQRLRIALPPVDQARAWLLGQGLDAPEALLALAGGSPLEALAWVQEGFTPALLSGLPRRVAAGDAAALQGRPIPRVVELLLKLAHDAQVQAAGGAPRFFAAAGLPGGTDLAALRTWQQALLRVARHDEHPWSAALLVESLVSQAAAVWPAPAPARGASLHSAR
ncbi:DNA polymerase III subunit delta' [Pseudaquabacterium pictum]|uniref:DNA polymerase III subunit delta n=1 Tax=Pseudaquabacterium pictum TaxID=2315236 RepID=A0A480ALH3_9BURK|nr:DNA polymerase III subunit delta' [Rubrivivax pictus]GCL61247.1 DNA polymerase III subunit delta' [Rubrivivax pictus]